MASQWLGAWLSRSVCEQACEGVRDGDRGCHLVDYRLLCGCVSRRAAVRDVHAVMPLDYGLHAPRQQQPQLVVPSHARRKHVT